MSLPVSRDKWIVLFLLCVSLLMNIRRFLSRHSQQLHWWRLSPPKNRPYFFFFWVFKKATWPGGGGLHGSGYPKGESNEKLHHHGRCLHSEIHQCLDELGIYQFLPSTTKELLGEQKYKFEISSKERFESGSFGWESLLPSAPPKAVLKYALN